MRIITWNINSVRLRLPLVEQLIAEYSPDVLCLQETKSPDDHFPADTIAEYGLEHQIIWGMKGYNGVAILSRLPLTKSKQYNWTGKPDCRYIAATIDGTFELHNFYIPAGGDIPNRDTNEKFDHKLNFVDEMTDWFAHNRTSSHPMMLVGDLNIAPSEYDVWSHKQLLKIVSHTPIEIEKLVDLFNGLKWVDAIREIYPEPKKLYSWWSYRSRDWEKSDRGRRLDHIWVTEPLRSKVTHAEILRSARNWQRPSDHAPVLVDLDL